MAGLFGTSGIRGRYGIEITPGLAMKVGRAIGKAGGKVLVAQDARETSPVLCEALCAGAMHAGADAVSLALAPTPLLAYATMRGKCAGAMITASHNPPEYNGMKLFSGGMEISERQEKEVEASILSGGRGVEWSKAGQRGSEDYSEEYISFLVSKVDASSISARKPRVLVDCGNAAACKIAPLLLRKAGCEVVPLYCDSPGEFTRDLEPKKGTLAEASRVVKGKKCDFGIAFDGDGDRAIAIDENGEALALDAQLAIFCSYFAKMQKGSKVISTVEASLCVRKAVEEAGGKIEITPVGSRHVAEAVLRSGACFGGEPCGEYVFPSSTPCADGLLAALFIAEIFCKQGRLSALSGKVQQHPIERRKYKCAGKDKAKIMERLRGSLKLPGAKLSETDGLRFDFPDGWLLVRPSGTEPAIRLTCEFAKQGELKETVAFAEKEILAAIG